MPRRPAQGALRFPAIPRRIALILVLSGCVAVFAHAIPGATGVEPRLGVGRAVPLHVEPDGRAPSGDRNKARERRREVGPDRHRLALAPAQSGAGCSDWHVRLADRCVNLARATRDGGPRHSALDTGLGQRRARPVRAPPRRRADFARFARWTARHFRGRVGAWEVWNEPNDRALLGRARARQYVRAPARRLPRRSRRATRTRSSSSADSCRTTSASSTRAYAAGAQGSFDVMATHPYQGNAPPEARRRRRRLVAASRTFRRSTR